MHGPHAQHGHHHAAIPGSRAFAWGVGLNLGFVLLETAAGLWANSLALLSDAAHNATDVLSLLLAWGALWLSRRPADWRRTYGLRRGTILSALFSGAALVAVVGLMLWEALQRLQSPQPVLGSAMIWVAVAGVLVNGASAALFMRDSSHDVNLRGAYLHLLADAGISLGVVLTGVGLWLTGWQWLDPAVSAAIALVILWGTWGLLREALGLALDAVPAHIDAREIESFLRALPGVEQVHDLHIWGISTTEVALTAHLVMPVLPASDAFLQGASRALAREFGIGHATLQLERGDGAACALAGCLR